MPVVITDLLNTLNLVVIYRIFHKISQLTMTIVRSQPNSAENMSKTLREIVPAKIWARVEADRK
jgi:hypothetical protein